MEDLATPMCPLNEPNLYCFFVIDLIAPATGHNYVLVKTDPLKNSPPSLQHISSQISDLQWQHARLFNLHLTHSLQLMQLTALTDHSLWQHTTHSSLTECGTYNGKQWEGVQVKHYYWVVPVTIATCQACEMCAMLGKTLLTGMKILGMLELIVGWLFLDNQARQQMTLHFKHCIEVKSHLLACLIVQK